jgi:hypothetical protein
MPASPLSSNAFFDRLVRRVIPRLLAEMRSYVADEADMIWLEEIARLLRGLEPVTQLVLCENLPNLQRWSQEVQWRLAVPDRYQSLRKAYVEPLWLLLALRNVADDPQLGGAVWDCTQRMLIACMNRVTDQVGDQAINYGHTRDHAWLAVEARAEEIALLLSPELGMKS